MAHLQACSLLDTVPTQSILFLAQVIQMNPNSVNEVGWGGLTPLHKACLRGDASIVELLLNGGAKFEIENEGGETPFHYAARRGNPVVLEILHKAGANPFQSDHKGRYAAHHAALSGSLHSLLWLESALNMSLDEKDENGRTPLYVACESAQYDVVKLLLKNKRSSPTAADNHGNTCLHAAVYGANEHIAYLLLNISTQCYERLIQSKNKSGESPYQYLASLPESKSNPMKFDSIRRLFWMVTYLPHPEAFSLCFLGSKITVAVSPFLIYLAGLLLYKYLYPQYGVVIMLLGSIMSGLFVRGQWHRMVDASRSPNPAYLAAFLTGVVHTALCFYLDVMPRLPLVDRSFHIIASVMLALIFSLVYLTLIIRDPGRVTTDRINYNTITGTPLTCAEHVRQHKDKPVIGYCAICEISCSDERVKHCKLCDVCILDLDHHCLFLMKCIAKNNHRLFVYLIIVTLLSITYFLYSAVIVYMPVCYAAANNPITLIKCLAQVSPWLFTALLFNIASFLWGFFMLRYQLMVIARDSTNYYFQNPGQFTNKEKWCNVIYFLLFGRLYKRKQTVQQSCYA